MATWMGTSVVVPVRTIITINSIDVDACLIMMIVAPKSPRKCSLKYAPRRTVMHIAISNASFDFKHFFSSHFTPFLNVHSALRNII